jgi:O-antigen ligase
MNVRRLKELPSIALMTVFFGVFISYLDHHLESRGLLPFLNVTMFLACLAVMTAGTLVRVAASTSEAKRLIALLRSHIAVLAPLAAVVVASFASAFLPAANLDDGPRYVLYPAYNAAIIVLAMLLPFQEHHRRWFRWYLGIAFALVAASIFTDVVRPGTFSILPDRAAGFARNPNGGAFVLVSLCCALISFTRVRGLDLLVLGVTALGVLATLSRGGALLFAVVVCCYAPAVVRHAARRGVGVVLLRLVALVALVAGTYTATTRLINQRMFSGPGSRIEMLLGTQEVVGPRESRISLFMESWELVRASPLLGYGSGYTFTLGEGPHNIYLSRWLDNGLPGLISFVWLLAAAGLTFWRRRYTPGLVFTGVVALEGLFSHNLLEERVFLFLLGALLTLSLYPVSEEAPAPEPRRRRRRHAFYLDGGAAHPAILRSPSPPRLQ